MVGEKIIGAPPGHADGLFAAEIKIAWHSRRVGEGDGLTMAIYFCVRPGAVGTEIKFRIQDSPLIKDHLNTSGTGLVDILKPSRYDYARYRLHTLNGILDLITENTCANKAPGYEVVDRPIVMCSILGFEVGIGGENRCWS